MLDINLIRENPGLVTEKLARKGFAADFGPFLARDAERRRLIQATEQLKAEKNKTSARIPILKKEKQDVAPLLARMKAIGEEIRSGDEKIDALDKLQQSFLETLPNLPADDVVAGRAEPLHEVLLQFEAGMVAPERDRRHRPPILRGQPSPHPRQLCGSHSDIPDFAAATPTKSVTVAAAEPRPGLCGSHSDGIGQIGCHKIRDGWSVSRRLRRRRGGPRRGTWRRGRRR